MKSIFKFFVLFFIINSLNSQSIMLPYYTGFDSPSERAGWQQFRTGFHSSYDWNDNGALSHDYNVGGTPSDTVIDWYVSPPLNLSSYGNISMKVKTGGFSTPTPDNCEVWFGTESPNPSIGDFVLIANLSYMEPQYQWLDTIIDLPFVSDSGYIAFKYKTIGAAWMTYSIDSITVSLNTGIDENSFSKTGINNIFPNPLSSETTIYFDSEIKDGHIELFNAQGQKLKSFLNINGENYKLDLKDLAAGFYMIILSGNNGILAKRKILIAD